MWTRRGLNPRPNGDTKNFLHAYLCFNFRAATRPKLPIATLSSKKIVIRARPLQTILDIAAPYVSDRLKNAASGGCLVSTPCVEIKLIYCTSIKQRERTCFRQLNFREPRLKCPLTPALHAYSCHLPAVKSSLALKVKRIILLLF